eukprot:4846249-Pleurochrysis_carterae.AAC.1
MCMREGIWEFWGVVQNPEQRQAACRKSREWRNEGRSVRNKMTSRRGRRKGTERDGRRRSNVEAGRRVRTLPSQASVGKRCLCMQGWPQSQNSAQPRLCWQQMPVHARLAEESELCRAKLVLAKDACACKEVRAYRLADSHTA